MNRIFLTIALLLSLVLLTGSSRRREMMRATAASGYSADSTRFTTDDYMSRGAGLTGAANGTNGTLAGWVKSYTTGNTEFILINSGLDFLLYKTTAGLIKLQIKDIVSATAIDMTSTASIEGGAWHHFALTWNTNGSASCKIYVDGVEGTTVTTCSAAQVLDYTHADWRFGHTSSSMNMDVSELWFSMTEDIDLATYITSWRSAGGAPVELGSGGAVAGITPIIYYKSPFHSLVNIGTGGDFSVTAGTLAAGSAIP